MQLQHQFILGVLCLVTQPCLAKDLCLFDCFCKEDNGHWRDEILKDVSSLSSSSPGSLQVWGPKAEAIVGSEYAAVAAAELGKGRLIVFAHNGFTSRYMDVMRNGEGDSNDKQLVENMIGWLLKDPSVKSLKTSELKDVSSKKSVDSLGLEDYKLVVWQRGGTKSPGFAEALTKYVKSGGALLIGINGWANVYGMETMTVPVNKLLQQAGVMFVNEGSEDRSLANDPTNIHFITNMSRTLQDIDAVENFAFLRNNLERIGKVDAEFARSCLRPGFDALLKKLKEENPDVNIVPTYTNPVTGRGKVMLIIQEAVRRFLGGDGRLPGIDQDKNNIPGLVEVPPGDEQSVVLEITSHVYGYYSTGLYVPTGGKLKVEVLSKSPASSEWYAYVGCHQDYIIGKKKWYRYPKVYEKLNLGRPEPLEAESHFGGPVYFYSNKAGATLKVRVSGVVQAPYVNTAVPESLADWPERKNAPGAWADISGEFMTLTVPSHIARQIKDVAGLMRHWDKVVKAYNHLLGTDVRKDRHQWFVYDVQISAGYMHSGYPIPGQVLENNWRTADIEKFADIPEALILPTLSAEGAWGLYHELGHNHQVSAWKFDEQGEVTVNVYSMYAFHKVHGNATSKIERYDHTLDAGVKYVEKPCTTPYKRHSAWAGLAAHVQLFEAFGFSAYEKVLREYTSMPKKERPGSNQEKIDQWVQRLSNVVGYNLAPFYNFWCYPVSEGIAESLSDLKPWLPDDRVTRAAPKKVQEILEKHSDVDREGKLVPDNNYDETVGPPPAPYPWVKVIA